MFFAATLPPAPVLLAIRSTPSPITFASMVPSPLALASGVATSALTMTISWNTTSASSPLMCLANDVGGLLRVGDGVPPAFQRGLHEALHLLRLGLKVLLPHQDAVGVEREPGVGEKENLRFARADRLHHAGHRHGEVSIAGIFFAANMPTRAAGSILVYFTVSAFRPFDFMKGLDHLLGEGCRRSW